MIRGWRVDYIVDPATKCWVWQGARDRGYGVTKDGKRAHRFYYERYRGPIPKGMTIDHLCRNTLCVNPAHLGVCSRTENLRREGKSRRKEKLLKLGEEVKTWQNEHPIQDAQARRRAT